jgi:hypothetical protein
MGSIGKRLLVVEIWLGLYNQMRKALYLFWSRSDIEVFGFTADVDGRNLPVEFGPWERNGDGACLYAGADESLPVSDPVRLAIQNDGFYLGRSSLLATYGGTESRTF